MADSNRDRLAETAAFLTKLGEYDRANSVQAVLAPGGWKQLRDTEDRVPKTLPVYMSPGLKEALEETSKEFGWPLDALAEEAYQKVRDGKWLPPKRGRGEPGPRVVLSVQVDQALFDRVHAMLPELKEKAGYQVSHAGIIQAYLADELGIERPNTAKAESLEMRFPKSLVAHWEREAGKRGQSLQEIVEERIPAVLDGSWVPERSAYMTASKRGRRTNQWSDGSRQRLWLPIDKDLLSGLREKAEELTESTGHLMDPGVIVRAILTDRLGEPTE